MEALAYDKHSSPLPVYISHQAEDARQRWEALRQDASSPRAAAADRGGSSDQQMQSLNRAVAAVAPAHGSGLRRQRNTVVSTEEPDFREKLRQMIAASRDRGADLRSLRRPAARRPPTTASATGPRRLQYSAILGAHDNSRTPAAVRHSPASTATKHGGPTSAAVLDRPRVGTSSNRDNVGSGPASTSRVDHESHRHYAATAGSGLTSRIRNDRVHQGTGVVNYGDGPAKQSRHNTNMCSAADASNAPAAASGAHRRAVVDSTVGVSGSHHHPLTLADVRQQLRSAASGGADGFLTVERVSRAMERQRGVDSTAEAAATDANRRHAPNAAESRSAGPAARVNGVPAVAGDDYPSTMTVGASSNPSHHTETLSRRPPVRLDWGAWSKEQGGSMRNSDGAPSDEGKLSADPAPAPVGRSNVGSRTAADAADAGNWMPSNAAVAPKMHHPAAVASKVANGDTAAAPMMPLMHHAHEHHHHDHPLHQYHNAIANDADGHSEESAQDVLTPGGVCSPPYNMRPTNSQQFQWRRHSDSAAAGGSHGTDAADYNMAWPANNVDGVRQQYGAAFEGRVGPLHHQSQLHPSSTTLAGHPSWQHKSEPTVAHQAYQQQQQSEPVVSGGPAVLQPHLEQLVLPQHGVANPDLGWQHPATAGSGQLPPAGLQQAPHAGSIVDWQPPLPDAQPAEGDHTISAPLPTGPAEYASTTGTDCHRGIAVASHPGASQVPVRLPISGHVWLTEQQKREAKHAAGAAVKAVLKPLYATGSISKETYTEAARSATHALYDQVKDGFINLDVLRESNACVQNAVDAALRELE